MLSVGVGENPRESLSELARLGARLIIQRAVEDEFDAWLGRARYERRPADQGEERGEETGLRNGFRPRRVQTAEGELEIEIPQVRQAAETFASKLFPRTPKLLRTEPLKALVIGAFVRGLSMRDVESLCEQAGLGKLSKSTASRMCEELKERFERFRAPRPVRDPAGRAVPRRDVHRCATGRAEGGRAGRVGVHRGRRAGAVGGQLGDARVVRGLADPRPRPDQPRARSADADRRRRRPRADQGDRAVLAGVRPPALLRSPRPEPVRQAPRPRPRTRQARLLASVG